MISADYFNSKMSLVSAQLYFGTGVKSRIQGHLGAGKGENPLLDKISRSIQNRRNDVIQIHSRSMSNPTLSDIDFKN